MDRQNTKMSIAALLISAAATVGGMDAKAEQNDARAPHIDFILTNEPLPEHTISSYEPPTSSKWNKLAKDYVLEISAVATVATLGIYSAASRSYRKNKD